MELNEITRKLPPHLMQFVVDQPYHQYSSVDQAVWRYVMRKNLTHLSKVAHDSYLDGLKKAGIEIDKIPTMYGMNRILQKLGWAAVAVDGFIPPGAFMEFTAFRVLVIAADIRTLEHIEYTPAPDIIHESAGHAPIIADPDFADYLVKIGKIGSRAFSSKKDFELYEAIRHLSIIKEDPSTTKDAIDEGEALIAKIASDMGTPSEMALLRNLHWWTVEYGLIGTIDDYRIYGAGLLSSIGESESCLRLDVKKIPYSIDAAYCNYDITRAQPQLFVTPSFQFLSVVLDEFVEGMALKTGGIGGLQKALDSEGIATVVYDSVLQVTGVFTDYLLDSKGALSLVKAKGKIAFALEDKQIANQTTDFISPVGNLINLDFPVSLKIFKDKVINEQSEAILKFESGIEIRGILKNTIEHNGLIVMIELIACRFRNMEGMLYESEGSTWLALGREITSVFSGPADVVAYQQIIEVPREKTHKIVYDDHAKRLQNLYDVVRTIRIRGCDDEGLPKVTKMLHRFYPDDWLLNIELLELYERVFINKKMSDLVYNHLLALKVRKPNLSKLIDDGISLIFN